LPETDYRHLENAAKQAGKSVQAFVYEWIIQLSEVDETFDVTQDPVFQMEGYESEAPTDLSLNLDQYLYGEDLPK
jgi:hypothetical protein